MKTRQILTLITYVVMLVVNGLANALPLNGKLSGEISDSFPVLFTPAGYVFAIWGLIYLLLFGFVIYQALPSQRENSRLQRIGTWFIASNLFNSAWIFLWHYGFFPLTLVAMLGLLVSLLMIYVRLDIGKKQFPLAEKILVNLPFSVYLGWISVATIANFSITLYDLGWNGGGIAPAIWTIGVLLAATSLGAAMIRLRGDVAYALVLVWAFVGITVKQSDTQSVAITAAVAAAALLIILAVHYVRRVFHLAREARVPGGA